MPDYPDDYPAPNRKRQGKHSRARIRKGTQPVKKNWTLYPRHHGATAIRNMMNARN